MTTVTQLDFITALMAEETKRQQFIDSILHEIKNVKYLRSEVESVQALYSDTNKDFFTLSAISNSLGNVLYFLAALAESNSGGISKFISKGRDWFYNKIVNKGPSSSFTARSTPDLYNLSRRTKRRLESFILANQDNIDKRTINNKLVSSLLDSMDNSVDYLKQLK